MKLFGRKKKADSPVKDGFGVDLYFHDMDKEPEPLNGDTLIEIFKECTERISNALEMNDCDECVTIHVSRKVGAINLQINKEVYVHVNNEWAVIPTDAQKERKNK